MKVSAVIAKMNDEYFLSLPKEAMAIAKFKEGQTLEIHADAGSI